MHITELIKRGKFVVTCEIDSPKGVNQEDFLDKVDMVKESVDAVCVGDNLRAVMRCAPLAMCHLLQERAVEPVMQMNTRDRNRLAIQSDLLAAATLGVENIAFNGIIRSGEGKSAEAVGLKDMEGILERLRQIANESDVKLIWYTPTPYCEFNPINHGLGIKQCTACSINMAIEPDGTVLPCQSYYEGLGNILDDDWEDIWNHELCKRIRERRYLPEKCNGCELLDACGGGCPLSIEHGDYLCVDRHSG